MNIIVVKGRLTRDPELKYVTTANGEKAVCNFSVAADNPFSEGATFFNCQAWGKTAEAINKFMKKGNMILVNGSMQASNYEKEGEKRTFWRLVCERFEFCESAKKKEEDSELPAGFEVADDEDELPF